jgi:mandelamide amidase
MLKPNHPTSRREFLAQSSAALILARAQASGAQPSPPNPNAQTLTELSASSAVAAMRKGDLKAEDYATALLAQAERWKDLNAFRALDPDSVRAAARAADQKRASGARPGPLHGLPIPVKDSVNTRALPTTNGTKALRNFRPTEDADVLKPLFAAGAFLMGKTNLHELSCGWSSNNQAFGPVYNPYDLRRTPGGSSGGSAATVAARVAPLAIAEDTYGSIRVPATFCGLAGLRCTFGRYPGRGMMPLAQHKFDQVGPLARQVEDLILFDSVLTGSTQPVLPRPLTGIRIGISPDYLAAHSDPETTRIFEAALDRMKSAGVSIVHAELPPPMRAASDVVRFVLGYELLESLAGFLEQYHTGISLDQLIAEASPNLQPLLTASRNPGPPERYAALLRQQAQIKAATLAYYREHRLDAIAFPPSATPAFQQGDSQEVEINGRKSDLFTTIGRNVGLGSCAGLACLVLPAGLTRSGLPVGLEFDALPGTDRQLLALGLSLEPILGPIAPPPLRA